MKKCIRIFTCLFVCKIFIKINVNAQSKNDTTLIPIKLNEVVITVNKMQEEKLKIPNQVVTISSLDIDKYAQSNTADLLQSTGQINVQKSQQGGGSPVLRGFESSRVLLLVDGVRQNNLIYRAGHLQNIITINQSILENIEVVMGPSSTVYGSDALGGIIHLITKKPILATTNKMLVKTSIYSKYASANNEKTGGFNLNFGFKKIAFLSAVNYSDFGDLTMGKKTNPFLGEQFGTRNTYVQNINYNDSVFLNSNKFVQKFSGYKQYDFMQKVLINQSEKITHLFNFQFSNSSHIPRYDRLTDVNSKNQLSVAEWLYGPQKRQMASYNFEYKNLTEVLKKINVISCYQDIEESRITRNFGSKSRSSRIENVKVASLLLDLDFVKQNHDFRLGFDGQYNSLKSTATKTNIITGEISPQNTRYPDGKNELVSIGIYGSHKYHISNKIFISDGVRFSYYYQNSKFIDKTFFPFPFSNAKQNVPSITGNLGIVFLPSEKLKLSSILSSGFRVPNVDDLSKVFDQPSKSIIVPNPKIKPEKTVNLETGISFYFNQKNSIENTIWATYYFDAISLAPSTFNGLDSINYNGNLCRVFSNQNVNKAILYGYSGALKIYCSNNLQVQAFTNLTYGKLINDSSSYPLDHIPPAFGSLAIKYQVKNIKLECFNNFNAWKRAKDYNMFGEDNFGYAHPRGTPAWFTVNLRSSILLKEHFNIQFGIDNLLDTQYRTFSSGINSPGRSFILSFKVNY